jgi:hypothetical protein
LEARVSLPTSQDRGAPSDFRASLVPYVVFSVILGTLIIFLGIVGVAKEEASVWWPVTGCVLALAFVLYWLSRFRLIITAESVTYASLFTGTCTVRRREIAMAEFAEHTGPMESPFTFVILTKTGEQIRINAKVFPQIAVDRLMKLLEEPT